MASTISKLLCHALSIAFAIGGGARCLAQANVQHNSSYDSLQVPKLCMPVSYHQSFPEPSDQDQDRDVGRPLP